MAGPDLGVSDGLHHPLSYDMMHLIFKRPPDLVVSDGLHHHSPSRSPPDLGVCDSQPPPASVRQTDFDLQEMCSELTGSAG
jgi:hypothetical protein